MAFLTCLLIHSSSRNFQHEIDDEIGDDGMIVQCQVAIKPVRIDFVTLLQDHVMYN